MQMNGIVVSFCDMNTVVIVVMVVNHFFVKNHVRQCRGLLLHNNRRNPGQRLPQHDSDQDEGLARMEHCL